MAVISNILAREILDSRGSPTVEVDIFLDNGVIGRASVPSGASTGKYEAHERRDGEQRYHGKGVKKVIHDIMHVISESIVGISVYDQRYIDSILCKIDGTNNKSLLGANAILGVSLAVARAASFSIGLPLYRYLGGCFANILPVPMMNVLNGGMHADNKLTMQEFMIAPIGASSFREAVQIGSEIYMSLKSELKKAGHSINIGDEGGFAPNLDTAEEALDYILQAINTAGLDIKKVHLALDCAASNYFDNEIYYLDKPLDRESYIAYLNKLCKDYPIFSIEDAISEDDWIGWRLLTNSLGEKIQLVGDDLFVTNKERLSRGIQENVANAILIKVNQIGSVSEACDVVYLAKQHAYNTVISHRSGETEDTFIADLSVATASGQIKTGAPARSDRTAKYNQLIRIEEELGGQAIYAGCFFNRIN